MHQHASSIPTSYPVKRLVPGDDNPKLWDADEPLFSPFYAVVGFMRFLWCLQWTGLAIQRDDSAAAAPR